MKVIDVHTHMLNEGYLRLLRRYGGKHRGKYTVRKVVGGQTGIHRDGAPFMTLTPGMLDYEARLRAMDAAGVDMAIVTLTIGRHDQLGSRAISSGCRDWLSHAIAHPDV